jgi:hypothetical protein
MASSREDLHHLVEELPAEQVGWAARVLVAFHGASLEKISAAAEILRSGSYRRSTPLRRVEDVDISVVADTSTAPAPDDRPALRDFGGFLGSVDAEPDFAERSEEILRERFRGDHGAA